MYEGPTDDLGRREKEATIAKLEAERRKLESEKEKLDADRLAATYQFTPESQRRENWKAFAGIGGLVTAIVATLALLASSVQWTAQFAITRNADDEQRLERALTFSADNASATKRVSGVILLESFLNGNESEDKRERALLFLANSLAVESDPTVRGAVLSSIKGISMEKRAPTRMLSTALLALIDESRTLVQSAGLRSHHETQFMSTTSGPEVQARSIAEAIIALLRGGARVPDMSSIYCVGCDFSKLSLDSVSFDNALLQGANFDSASLVGSTFDQTELEDTYFVEADLRSARITMLHPFIPNGIQYSWNRFGGGAIQWPHFYCADLRGATFTQEVLFGFARIANYLPENMFQSTFFGSNISNTDFRAFSIVVLSSYANSDSPIEYSSSSARTTGKSGVAASVFNVRDPGSLTKAASSYSRNISDMLSGFTGSNWPSAKLPGGIASLLRQRNVSSVPQGSVRIFENGMRTCTPRAPW